MIGSGGCGSTAAVAPLPAPGAADEAGVEAAEQRIYRLRYTGPEGAGTLRVVLRLESFDRFTLQASDTFGRRVWDLDVDRRRALWIDHRQRSLCQLEADAIVLQELAIGPLSARSIARLLLSRLPVELPSTGDGPFAMVDDLGRRWTGKRDGEGLVQWTLWLAGEPEVWWSREERGGVLSSRDGAQARWRLRLAEPLATEFVAVTPSDYSWVTCDG